MKIVMTGLVLSLMLLSSCAVRVPGVSVEIDPFGHGDYRGDRGHKHHHDDYDD